MKAVTFDAMTPLRRTIVEQALVLAKELEAAAGSAPDGQVIDRRESFLLGSGRDFLRRGLKDTLQGRADALEEMARPGVSAAAACPAGTRGDRSGR